LGFGAKRLLRLGSMYVVVVEVVAHRNECFTTCKLKGGKRRSSGFAVE